MMADLNLQAQQAAVEVYFGGDRALFDEFRTMCLTQFPRDLAQGRSACRAQDWPLLRRTAHNLKSVLLTLGYKDLSLQAAQCETLSQQENSAAAEVSWGELQASLAKTLDL